VGRCGSFDYCLYPSDGIRNCAHDEISPQRIRDNSRTGSFGFWRMTGTRLRGSDIILFQVYEHHTAAVQAFWPSHSRFPVVEKNRPH